MMVSFYEICISEGQGLEFDFWYTHEARSDVSLKVFLLSNSNIRSDAGLMLRDSWLQEVPYFSGAAEVTV